jgi:hypothetical protein
MNAVTILEFPGVLADSGDASGAVAALGGTEALRAATQLDAPDDRVRPLTLNLRPGELSSRSNVGSTATARNHDTCLFVLHVTSPSEGASGGSSSARVLATARIEGKARRVISFPGIADFQLFSRDAVAEVEPALSLGPSQSLSPWVHGPANRRPVRGTSAVAPAPANEGAGLLAPPAWREKTEAEALAEAAWRLSVESRAHAGADAENAREVAERATWLSDMRPVRFARSVVEEGIPDTWFREFALGVPDVLHDAGAASRNTPASAGRAEEADGLPAPCTPEVAGDWQLVDDQGTEPSAPGKSRLLKIDKRKLRTRLISLPYRVDPRIERVPQVSALPEPSSPLAETIAYLRGKFAARPLWTRRVLLYDADVNVRKNFKAAIVHVAYAFSTLTGPFHSLWIRYGYDPRSGGGAKNRVYQSVEIRFPDAVTVAAIEKVYGTDAGRDDTCDVGNHSLAALPSKRQLTLQLCDIVAPGLDVLLVTPANVCDEYDHSTGYLTPAGLDAVLVHLRRRARKLVVEALGEEETASITERNALRRKLSKKKQTGGGWSSATWRKQGVPSSTRHVAGADDEAYHCVADPTLQASAVLHGAGVDVVGDEAGDDADDPRLASEASAAQEAALLALADGIERDGALMVSDEEGALRDAETAAGEEADSAARAVAESALHENEGGPAGGRVAVGDEIGREDTEKVLDAATSNPQLGSGEGGEDGDAASVEGIEIYGDGDDDDDEDDGGGGDDDEDEDEEDDGSDDGGDSLTDKDCSA